MGGNLNMASNTITLALVDTNIYLVSDAHEDRADIANNAIVLEANLTNKTINSGIFSADDVSFSGITAANTAEAIVLYHNDIEGGQSTSRLIVYIDNANGLPTPVGVGIDVNIQFSNELTKIFSL